MSKPLIGITTYVEPASWGHWNLEAALVPYDYVRAVERAGARPILIPPSEAGVDERGERFVRPIELGVPTVRPSRRE